ncbi:MAG TPA: ATP-binding protein, partial [Ramlibacter sp.]|nr:ATP-binding protein [Ramlibacter sp.]
SEQKSAFERVHQSQKMEALGSLAGGVAHEFNNLLLVISGFAQTALNRAEDPKAVRDALDEVLTASGRAAELSGQMLTFSRNWVSEGKVVSVAQELDQLRRLVSLQARGLTVTMDADPELRVQVDGSNFLQALLNLTLNARDAMQRGGVLEITARRITAEREIRSLYGGSKALPAGDYAEIVVRDDGAGIPRDVLPRIFEPFFSTKPPGEGTGLGLSFVFGVIKQAGGLIDVRSTPGQGTTFSVYLPASTRPVTAAPKDAPYVGGDETVLIVDDEPQVRAAAAAFYERLGYAVLQAGSALEALDLFDARRDDIAMVLTDVMMPDMDGFELAEVLREVGCQAPISFMTGCVPDLERDGERFTRSSSIIRKPFTLKDIALFTRRVLDEKAAA